MQVAVIGGSGALGTATVRALEAVGAEPVLVPRSQSGVVGGGPVVVAAPTQVWPEIALPSSSISVGAALRHPGDTGVTVPCAGWFGGLGTLLAAVAVAEAAQPLALHVAYGLPGAGRVLGRVGPSVTHELRSLATPGRARRDGQWIEEPLAEGRRLAWFPRPVGPAHSVAVGGVEAAALPELDEARTWLAAGATAAELLQALGRSAPDGWLARRLLPGARRGGGPGATDAARWAVVAEVLDGETGVVRAWANGTGPVLAAGALVATVATRLADGASSAVDGTGTVLDAGPPDAVLDTMADLDVLRWSVSRPEPARR